jgi:hypothetical protein
MRWMSMPFRRAFPLAICLVAGCASEEAERASLEERASSAVQSQTPDAEPIDRPSDRSAGSDDRAAAPRDEARTERAATPKPDDRPDGAEPGECPESRFEMTLDGTPLATAPMAPVGGTIYSGSPGAADARGTCTFFLPALGGTTSSVYLQLINVSPTGSGTTLTLPHGDVGIFAFVSSSGNPLPDMVDPVSSGNVTINRAGTHPGEQFCATIDIDLVYGTGVATSRRVHVSGAFSVLLQENAPTAPAQ